jgi:predicted acetylornithine/succinylornithine family transaminase
LSALASHAVLPTYVRQDVTIVRGSGCWVESADGNRFLDLVGGIAVVGLGHGHPAPLSAAQEQLQKLWHVSNLYWTEPMQALSVSVSNRFGGARSFFCNSGAEAIEAAIKWARKATGRTGIVALEGSFHGRTLGALSITGQPAKRTAFEPLLPGVTFARLNDIESLAAAVNGDTAAIVIEPIQGEGGVHPADVEFLVAARTLADGHGAMLIFDEVQTGVGRTGSFFAFEQLGVKPDAATLAKSLANGLPIGCLLVSDDAPQGLEPGDHASTFGGNPVACAAACAVCDTITDELLAGVHEREQQLRASFPTLRGRGLLLALDVDRPAAEVVDACRERGVLVCTAGERTVRLTPPLTISAEEVDLAIQTLTEVLQ